MFDSAADDPGGSRPGHDGARREARRVAAAAAVPPGPLAMGVLAAVDPVALDESGRIDLLVAWERQSRWVAAQQTAALVAVVGEQPADRDDFVREHVRAALRECGGSPRADVDTARALAGPLTSAQRAMGSGAISYQHVRVLAQETEVLDPVTRRRVSEAVVADVDAARERGVAWTPSELRRRVRRAVIAADPVAAELRAEEATRCRHVARRVEADAQASLFVNGPAVGVQTVWTALDLLAGTASADDPRTLDQLRFDALVDICRQATTEQALAEHRAHVPAGRRRMSPRGRTGLAPAVFLHASAATWAGLADDPVELDGYGPVPAGVARAHFSDSQWRAVVTDALTGAPMHVSDAGYRPSACTRRLLVVQDRACCFPGCLAAVWFCDADHSVPHDQGGCTDPENCGLLCRRHHRLKTFTRWTWRRLPDGAVEWTDPEGGVWVRPPRREPDLPWARPTTDQDLPPDDPDGPGEQHPTRAGPLQHEG